MDSKKEFQGNTPYGFIPRRLKVGDNKPTNFPFNVLFMSWTRKEGKLVSGSALYEPDLATYRQEKEKQILEYRNAYGEDSWLRITYDKKKKSWIGEKFVNGKSAGAAFGSQWDEFFIHFTVLGLSQGEGCMFGKLETENQKEANKANESFEVFCDKCGKVIRVITLYPEGENKENPKLMIKASSQGWICESTIYCFEKDDLTKEDLFYVAELLRAKNFRELRVINENMFGFFCVDCGKNYCVNCWKDIETIYDEDFYDYTLATCPTGHRHEIND